MPQAGKVVGSLTPVGFPTCRGDHIAHFGVLSGASRHLAEKVLGGGEEGVPAAFGHQFVQDISALAFLIRFPHHCEFVDDAFQDLA